MFFPAGYYAGSGHLNLVHFVEEPKKFARFIPDKMDFYYVPSGENKAEPEYFLGISSVRNSGIFLIPVEYFKGAFLKI